MIQRGAARFVLLVVVDEFAVKQDQKVVSREEIVRDQALGGEENRLVESPPREAQ